uniref:Uncharacterized protein n=1 Tax=Cacopsylla melanoneura TaxID=428564 RepID=A0A8D8RAR0_9HEMI
MERVRYSRRVKSPSYYALEQQQEIVKARTKARSPSRGRSPSRSKVGRPRSRSRTPSRSRKAVSSVSSPSSNAEDMSPSVYIPESESKRVDASNFSLFSGNSSGGTPASPPTSPNPNANATPAANGAQKWKPNFQLFKPAITINKSAVLATFVDLLKVNVAVALVTAVFISTVFSYLLCNKNRCKLPTKVPGFAKLVQEISPLSAYVYLGFFFIQFLFTFIPKRSNVISALVSLFAIAGVYFYPLYPVTSFLDRPVEFLNLSLLTSLALATILFVKGYRKSRSSTQDKLVYGYLFGFRSNGEFFGKKLETIFHQIGAIQLVVLDILFAITVYELKFPILFSAVLGLHFLFVVEKILFAGKKDYLPIYSGFFSTFLYLVYPSISSMSLYVAYKTALKEHTFYEYAGVAAAFWLFGFYAYCKAKYDPPRRIAVRNVKGFKGRLGFVWNYILTSPWIGQAFIELSIAGAVLPYSYLSLISAVSYIALTKVVPLLY